MPMAARRRPAAVTADTMEMCKYLFGHAWYPYDAERRDGGWIEVVMCERCGSVRRTPIDRNGTTHGRAYAYPDGYREAGSSYNDRSDARAAYYASTTADELKERRARQRRR